MNEVEMHCIIKGAVQGVCFRASTREIAKKLGLTGTVKNLQDGSVEIYAIGTKELLDAFLQSLKTEVEAAKIESYDADFYSPKQKFQSFSVIF